MRPAKHQYTILKQICQHIPAHLVPKLARSFRVDKKARSFSPWSHVVAMLHVQIAHSLSLNDVADTLRNHSGVLTTIQLVSNCIDWAKHRRRKAAAKCHMQLNLQRFLPQFAIVKEASTADSTEAYRLCLNLKSGEIAVFDKAYMDLTHLADFLGHSRNAILWQVWMAMPAYVLIRFIGHLGQWNGTFRRLFTLLRGVLFSRLDAFSVMAACGTARG